MTRLLDAALTATFILGPIVLGFLWAILWYKISDGALWGIPIAFIPPLWAGITAAFYFTGGGT